MEIVLKKVSELKQYKKNAKLHPEWQVKQIADSINKFGFNDPIAIDEKGVIIEGHGRFLACKMLGMEEVPTICLDHMTEQEKKAYILAHNKINMATDFDIDILKSELEDITEINMDDFGFEVGEEFQMEDLKEEKYETQEEKYTKKIKGPLYEPKNEKPALCDIVDTSVYEQLLKEIEESEVSEEEKGFLKLSATRHIVFNYEKCADYYSHSNAETQQHMENSALVIVDFEKALERGFVRLNEKLIEEFVGSEADDE